jgi:micrococcal nuclease
MSRALWSIVAVVVVVVSTTTACAPGWPDGLSGRSSDGEATVVEVVDGDTVTVDAGGRREDVRLLGIDTPETVHPTKPVECFGPEASAHLESLLPPGTRVRLERDVESRDQYGRLLAHVRRADDDLLVNQDLVEGGFADVLVIEPNRAYAGVLRQARDQARRAGTGRWSACP